MCMEYIQIYEDTKTGRERDREREREGEGEGEGEEKRVIHIYIFRCCCCYFLGRVDSGNEPANVGNPNHSWPTFSNNSSIETYIHTYIHI